MANVFETTLACRLCNGVKRVSHLESKLTDKEFNGWKPFIDTKGRTRYVCNDCINMISEIVKMTNKE